MAGLRAKHLSDDLSLLPQGLSADKKGAQGGYFGLRGETEADGATKM
jgi:hypothetical protein